MFLSGLNSIDFRGLMGLSGSTPVDFETAVGLALKNVSYLDSFVVTEKVIRNQFNKFRSQGYSLVQSSSEIPFADDTAIANIAIPADATLRDTQVGKLIDVLAEEDFV